MLGQTIAPVPRSVQKVNWRRGITERAQNGVSRKKRATLENSMQGCRGECCKGGIPCGSPLSRCMCASKCAFLITRLLPELKPHVHEDAYRGRNPRLRLGRLRGAGAAWPAKGFAHFAPQVLHTTGPPSKKPWRNWRGRGVMLTEDTHCLYNRTSIWSIWGRSFGTHWILVAADPCITVTFDNLLMYGSLFSSQKGL